MKMTKNSGGGKLDPATFVAGMGDMYGPQGAETAREFLRTKPVCHLCGSAANGIGLFFPTDAFASQMRIPPKQGKQRLIFYRLCDKCLALSDAHERIERDMLL